MINQYPSIYCQTIDWALLEQKQIPPPYRPRLESERDLANFPPEFTDEPVHLTPDDAGIIGNNGNIHHIIIIFS